MNTWKDGIMRRFFKGAIRGFQERKVGGEEGMEGKLKGNYTRALSRGQNELIGKFKMGQLMEYTYIPTGFKRELVRFGVDCDWMG